MQTLDLCWVFILPLLLTSSVVWCNCFTLLDSSSLKWDSICLTVLLGVLNKVLYFNYACVYTQSYLTLCEPRPPGSSVHGIFWLPFLFPGDLPDPGIEPTSLVSPALAGRFFTSWATREIIISFKMSAIIELYRIVQKQMKNYCDWPRACVSTAQKTKLWHRCLQPSQGSL